MDTIDTGQGLNTEILHDLLSRGTSKKDTALAMGITVAELNKTIGDLTKGQGLLLKYRELQNLQLTDLQAKILSAITPEKIQCASLVELVSAFKVLKDKELVMTGKANNITGLVGYLVELEKEEISKSNTIDITAYEEAMELCEEISTVDDDDLPKL